MKTNEFELIPTFKQFKKLLNEKKEDQQYSKGCIMGYFNKGFKDPKIKKEDLYDNEDNEYGLEVEPHVTLLYGLLDDKINEEEIIKLLNLINCPEVNTNKISLFENEKFDVVKWDIESDELVLLNKMLCAIFPYESDFPDYHAHTTIAYCLPGKGKNYTEELKKPISKKIDYWVYSKADGKKIKIIPGKESEIIREPYTTNESIDIPQDKSFTYKGYTVNMVPNKKFKEAFNCTVYLGDEYKMGIKGPANYENAKEMAINFIENDINGTHSE